MYRAFWQNIKMRELSLNILDIAQNSVSAGADKIEITVSETKSPPLLTILIQDNGCGMDEETQKKVLDPFYTTRNTRKVGMGIPLFQMAAEMTGGSFSIDSFPGKGTKVKAVFHTDSIDFTPLGDVESSVAALVTMNESIDFLYKRSLDEREFIFSSAEIKETLEGVPLNEPSVIQWIQEYLAELAADLLSPSESEKTNHAEAE